MPKFITIYRNNKADELATLDEFLEMDMVGDALAELPEHVQAAMDEAIDDETAALLARYGREV